MKRTLFFSLIISIGFILIIGMVSCHLGPNTSGSSSAVAATSAPAQTPQLNITFQQKGGPFLIIGPNPGGIYPPHQANGYWWNEIDVTIENKCTAAVYIDPANFLLYISSQQTIVNSQYFVPTTLGKSLQSSPLPTEWVQPGTQVSGKLIFEVPEKLPDGTVTNGAYKMLRITTFQGNANCTPVYSPY